jgi:hypothetical protein
MIYLKVTCPVCGKWATANLSDHGVDQLSDGDTVEGIEGKCLSCGQGIVCDLYIDVLNVDAVKEANESD